MKIALLKTNFRDYALVWYMKSKVIAPPGRGRMLTVIQQAMFKEF